MPQVEIQLIKSDRLVALEERHDTLSDAAHTARAICRTAFGDLFRGTDLECHVSIAARRYPEDRGRALEDMAAWLADSAVEPAADANLVLLGVQHDDESIMGRAELGGDVAKVTAGNFVAAYDETTWTHNPLSFDARDVDNDGRFEDVTGNGRFSILDVQRFFSDRQWYADHPRPRLFDFNADGRLGIGDVQTLFSLLGDPPATAEPIPLEAPITPFPAPMAQALAAVPHEIGHNLGFTHDMGSFRVEERGGAEVAVGTLMIGPYYRRLDGTTGAWGQPIADVGPDDEVVFEFVFSDPLRERVMDVIDIAH